MTRGPLFVVNAGGHFPISAIQNPAWDFEWTIDDYPLDTPVGFNGRLITPPSRTGPGPSPLPAMDQPVKRRRSNDLPRRDNALPTRQRKGGGGMRGAPTLSPPPPPEAWRMAHRTSLSPADS